MALVLGSRFGFGSGAKFIGQDQWSKGLGQVRSNGSVMWGLLGLLLGLSVSAFHRIQESKRSNRSTAPEGPLDLGGSRLAGGLRPLFPALPSPTRRDCKLQEPKGLGNRGKPEQGLRWLLNRLVSDGPGKTEFDKHGPSEPPSSQDRFPFFPKAFSGSMPPCPGLYPQIHYTASPWK